MSNDLTHAEELEVGMSIPLGEHEVSLAEILDFGRLWSPLPVHTDAAFPGGPIASGMHTLAIFQRLFTLGAISGWATIAGRRVREVAFEAPVRPGMVLTGALVVDQVDLSHPRRGMVAVTGTLHHGDTLVLTHLHDAYLRRRSPNGSD